jgi:D-glycero-D-manno-heptose 1,7-bisphosphate phosphatase
LRRAAHELDIDLSRSWFVGDILDDVEAGKRAGCSTILVDLGTEARPDRAIRRPNFVARTTLHALRIIQSVETALEAVDLTYLPPSWGETGDQQPMSGVVYG